MNNPSTAKANRLRFRAWDGKEMHLFGICESIWPFSREWPIMQSTGLTDKNGKEIYEGDKVVFGWHETFSSGHWSGFICWDKGYACWMIETTEGISVHLADVLDENAGEQDIEVFCNIYQNPELLQ